jgi:hypothetical protein
LAIQMLMSEPRLFQAILQQQPQQQQHLSALGQSGTPSTNASQQQNLRNKVGIPVDVFTVQPFPISEPQCRLDDELAKMAL